MKNSFFLLFILNLSLFVGCNKSTDENKENKKAKIIEVKKPNDLLPKPQMVNILVALHLAEAEVVVKNYPSDTAKMYFKKKKEEILKSKKVKPDQFKSSYEYYVNNLKDMDEIYEKVVDSLSLKEATGKYY